MTKADRLEELLLKYNNRFVVNYFVEAYENVYNYLNTDYQCKEAEYYMDYGRLWGLQLMMQFEMNEEDSKELLDLILSL